MACNPETCDSATNQLKTAHTETRDQQLAAQSPTTRRRQETREQMPEAGDHAARVQEGAKRQESRRLEVPAWARGGPRFRTGVGKKEAAHYHSKNDRIWMCPNHLANSFYIKKAGKLVKKLCPKTRFQTVLGRPVFPLPESMKKSKYRLEGFFLCPGARPCLFVQTGSKHGFKNKQTCSFELW